VTAPRSLGEQLRAVFAVSTPDDAIAAILERLRAVEPPKPEPIDLPTELETL
jgi:hypothetical protein